MNSNWPNPIEKKLEPFHKCESELTIENGCIFWDSKMVIPKELQSAVLCELHEGHPELDGQTWIEKLRKLFVSACIAKTNDQKQLKLLSAHGSFQNNHGTNYILILLDLCMVSTEIYFSHHQGTLGFFWTHGAIAKKKQRFAFRARVIPKDATLSKLDLQDAFHQLPIQPQFMDLYGIYTGEAY
ncbi:hypothetical protein J437_LFUL017463 [Ladona fulva]|uniref:Uncharacterized protein n=1 Tax=Ladona fulva TaxID=123851 RepID=A0A8K0KMA0_LADFU|nr:hypothetical protein J437_LFUL017463 [Ladona fulva]